MKGTYRTYRFQLIATVTYVTNEFNQLVMDSESWRYRIQNPIGQTVYDSDTADPSDNQPFFSSALNAAIAKINQLISDGEVPPVFDSPGTLI